MARVNRLYAIFTLVCVLGLSGSLVQAAAPVKLAPVTDMDGTRHNFEQTLAQRKNVVLVFWQTWCSKCIREAPAVVAASQSQKAHFEFFGVVSGEDAYVDDRKVRKMTTSLGLPYPQIRDRDLSLSKTFDVKGTPTIVILGPGMAPIYVGHHLPEDWSTYAPRS